MVGRVRGGQGTSVWGRVVRAVAVVALVGAATLAGATAAQAEGPYGSDFTPQDNYCTNTVSDADCWHYGYTYSTPGDCGAAAFAVTAGFIGQSDCITSGRRGNTDLWIWRPSADCAPNALARDCKNGLRIPDWMPAGQDMPIPVRD